MRALNLSWFFSPPLNGKLTLACNEKGGKERKPAQGEEMVLHKNPQGDQDRDWIFSFLIPLKIFLRMLCCLLTAIGN